MSERLDRCPTCRSQDVDREHADRCKLRDATSAAAVKHGRDLDPPIHGQKTRDMWAHMHTRTGDPEVARDVVKAVIDLGWRPVVGKYDLWAAPTTPTTEEA